MKITLCGSTKFKEQFEIVNRQLSLQGHIVYSVSFFSHADGIELTDEQKATLDKVHKEKIDNSDAIFVVDVHGYTGASTNTEVQHAFNKGKKVLYLSSYELVSAADKTSTGKYDLSSLCINTKTNFEKDLYKTINEYVANGLSKTSIVHTLEYVTESCKMS